MSYGDKHYEKNKARQGDGERVGGVVSSDISETGALNREQTKWMDESAQREGIQSGEQRAQGCRGSWGVLEEQQGWCGWSEVTDEKYGQR